MKKRKNTDGFAMIEVLLAIVILAIGLLAGSRMQILGLNYTQAATTRSYAAMAANDILDRMRLNPDGQATYVNFTFTAGGNIPADQGCATNACNATQRANQDLRMWTRYFGPGAQLPPGATGAITLDGAGLRTTVTITWNDFISGSASANNEQVIIGAAL